MSAKYILRMQFNIQGDPHAIVHEVIRVCRHGNVDEVAFFVSAEELNDGHDSLARLRQWMMSIRPVKRALERRGVAVSLNPWHTVLHTDRGRKLKPDQRWQPMVDRHGRAAEAVVCPLDPGWRAYYRTALEMFSAEKFRVIWIDDDIRFHGHGSLDWGGCWCPLHVAEFNRRTGARLSRHEAVALVLRSGVPSPWRGQWLDMWDETQAALIGEWRGIVEAQGTRLGLMSSDPEAHGAEGRRWRQRWWPACARQFTPTHRPHFWSYGDRLPDALVAGLGKLQQNRMIQTQDTESDPEIENFPYGQWNKSFRQTLAQMTVAQVFGSDRLNVSLYDFMGNLPGDEPERALWLGRVKPMLSWIGDRFPNSLRAHGLGIPWHEDMSRLVRLDAGERDWKAMEVHSRGWDVWLAAMGFSFQKARHSRLNALSGRMPQGYSDEDLTAFLAQGLLLDGEAAAAMVERGFGASIGLQTVRWITQGDTLYSVEQCSGPEFALRPGGQMSVNVGPFCARLLQGRLMRGVRAISALLDPLQRKVGHGVTLFENHLGGRVAVVPWLADASPRISVHRQVQFQRLLDWLAKGRCEGRVEGGAWLIPQFFTDGRVWTGIVWNGCPDAVREFRVAPPTGMGRITAAVHGDAAGKLHPAEVRGRCIVLGQPMHQWEFVVLNPLPSSASRRASHGRRHRHHDP